LKNSLGPSEGRLIVVVVVEGEDVEVLGGVGVEGGGVVGEAVGGCVVVENVASSSAWGKGWEEVREAQAAQATTSPCGGDCREIGC